MLGGRCPRRSTPHSSGGVEPSRTRLVQHITSPAFYAFRNLVSQLASGRAAPSTGGRRVELKPSRRAPRHPCRPPALPPPQHRSARQRAGLATGRTLNLRALAQASPRSCPYRVTALRARATSTPIQHAPCTVSQGSGASRSRSVKGSIHSTSRSRPSDRNGREGRGQEQEQEEEQGEQVLARPSRQDRVSRQPRGRAQSN